MEKIWLAEYKKTGIPESVALPAENTSRVDIFERNFQKYGSRGALIFMGKVLAFNELKRHTRCGDDAKRISISSCGFRYFPCWTGVSECQPTLYCT